MIPASRSARVIQYAVEALVEEGQTREQATSNVERTINVLAGIGKEKLTPVEVASIQDESESGLSAASVGKAFGISTTAIYDIWGKK